MLSHEDERHHDQYADLHLVEDFLGFQVGEAGGEEVGDGGRGDEPKDEAHELGLEEFAELHLGPAHREDRKDVRPDQEFGDYHQLIDVFLHVKQIELGAFAVFYLTVELPAEAGIPQDPAQKEQKDIGNDN